MKLISEGTLGEVKRAAPWLMALVLVTLFVTVLGKSVVHFDTNDDPGMMMSASGILSSVPPSEDLVHTSPLIGLALKHLYLALPRVPWYPLYLQSLTVLYLGLCVYVAVNLVRASRWTHLIILLLLSPFFLYLIATLQFTLVALNLTAAALFFAVRELDQGTSRWPKFALALVLTFIAGCVRPRLPGAIPVGSLIVGFWAPALALGVLRAGRRRWAWLAFSALFIFTLFLPRLTSELYYRSEPGWARFYKANVSRGKLLDSPLALMDPTQPTVIEFLRETGWSVNDLRLAKSWFFANKQTFTYERIERFCQLVLPLVHHYNFWATAKVIPAIYWPFGSCSLLLALYLCVLRPTWRHIALQVAYVAYLFLLMVYICVVSKLVDRIMLPAMFTGAMVSIYLFSWSVAEDPDPAPRRAGSILTTLGVLVAAILIAVQVNRLGRIAARVDAGRVSLLDNMRELARINPSGYFISWGGHLQEQYWPPYSGEMERYPGIKVIRVGVITNSPVSDRWFRSLGPGELTDSILQRRDTYVVAPETDMQRLVIFYREHLGASARYYRPAGGDHDVWQVALSR